MGSARLLVLAVSAPFAFGCGSARVASQTTADAGADASLAVDARPDVAVAPPDPCAAQLDVPTGTVLWSKMLAQPPLVLAADSPGADVFIAGDFFQSLDLGGTTPLTVAPQTSALYAARLDCAGHVVWQTVLAPIGSTSPAGLSAMALDPTGRRVILAGSYQGTLQGTRFSLSSAAGAAFVLTIDDGGQVLGAEGFDGASAAGLAIDGSGDVFLTGSFGPTATFGGTVLTSAGDSDVFVASLDPAGSTRWAQRLGGPNGDTGRAVAVDATGRVAVAGQLDDQVAGEDCAESRGFVSLLDSSGNVQWTDEGPLFPCAQDTALDTTFDDAGNVLAIGSGEEPFPSQQNSLTYRVAISPDGGELQSYRYGLAYLGAMTWGPSGALVLSGTADDVAGYPDGGPDFGCGPIVNPYQADQAFVVALRPPSTCLWQRSWGGVAFPDRASAGLVTSTGHGTWVSGSFTGTLNIAGETYDGSAGTFAYLARLAP